MSVDSLSRLINAIATLLGVLVWPAVLFYILVRFSQGISDFVSSLGAVSLKIAGVEATATKKQNEAVAALTAAATTNPQPGSTPETTQFATREAVRVVGDVNQKQIRQIEGSKVLWVDDRPKNNIYERQALEAIGVTFANSISTEDALQKIASQRFDVIISDMGRPPDARAGYTLLEALRATGNRTPYIIYARSNSAEHKVQAKSKGALGSTNDPTELFALVLSALLR